MLHQLHRGLARDRLLPSKNNEKRRPRLTLLSACLCNNFRIDIGENGWRLLTIKVRVARSRENNLAALRQALDWLVVPERSQHSSEFFVCDRLKRAAERK